jgi:chemotaxis protein CheX
MKAEYINPFLVASMHLFKKYLGIEVTAGKPRLLEDPHNLEEVTGIIGLAGETMGAVVLSLSRDAAINVISQFSGKKYNALTNEVLDGVGEMVNIIAGNAKADLHAFQISISLPGVIVGSSSKIHWPEGVPVLSIPFKSELGDFSVNVSLREPG